MEQAKSDFTAKNIVIFINSSRGISEGCILRMVNRYVNELDFLETTGLYQCSSQVVALQTVCKMQPKMPELLVQYACVEV